MAMIVISTAFAEGEAIPRRYSCDGENFSPPLAWSGAPEEATSLALLCDDPDAPHGTFVHWVLFNIPSATQSLREGIPPLQHLPEGGEQGRNSAGAFGYTGPCPPDGMHRYYFTLYALDAQLTLSGDVTATALRAAMQGHILAEGQLMGRYTRAQSGRQAA